MGPEPEPEPEEGGTAELRLREIYAQHARHKLADVPALLVQFAGRESELVEKVERKYILGRGAARARNAVVATNAVTSETHPMRLSWVSATGADGGGGGGRLGLCFCPGKQIQRSRLRAGHEESGQPIMRDLGADLRRLRQHYGVTQLVCLLNDAELRSLGVRCVYRGAVEGAGLEFVHFPVVEGAGGADGPGRAGFVAAHEVIAAAAGCVEAGGRVVMHCRGGVGRAGMMGACTLLLLGEASTPSDAIALVRRRRCKQAVETRRQEDFVKAWHRWWLAEQQQQQRTHVGVEDEQGATAVTPAPATAVEAAGVGAAR